MKALLKIELTLSGLLLLVGFMFSGCKEKGCTNPEAINYSNVANEDDGSCIICKTKVEETGSLSTGMLDSYFSSPHYGETVANFTIRQYTHNYNNNTCGSKLCDFVVTVHNNMNQQMYFQYNIYISGDIYYNNYRTIALTPNQTLSLDTLGYPNVSNPCGNLSFSTFTINLSGSITYQ